MATQRKKGRTGRPRTSSRAKKKVTRASATARARKAARTAAPGDRVLRRQLVALLSEAQAHVSVEQALDGLAPETRGRRPDAETPSVFEQLEHMRLAQEDILRYTLDPGWKSPAWPEGYWPPKGHAPSDREWADSLARFKADLAEVCALASDPRRDLTARIPHGEGRTYLRQVLLVADHNAYHAGQIVHARRRLGAWPG